MSVGTPTVDANGVQYYPVTSVYQGLQQQVVRVLEPTNPAPGKLRRLLYVLPVDPGVDTLSSPFSDGLEELRLLDVPNRFNMTLIAPSFNYEPWYGDNTLDPTKRMESFMIDDLIPFGDTFAQGNPIPQRFLIGFSKSGNGVLSLILRHPAVFNAAADWDSPAQVNDISAYGGLSLNFGTQANFNLYNIPDLVASNSKAFQQQNRLWISGDQAEFTADMTALHNELTAASIPHTWVQGGSRVHSWNSGWLDGAVIDLDANTTLGPPTGGLLPARSGGQPSGVLGSGTVQTTLSLMTDENATCRYATSAGVPYGSMNTFSSTGGTTHTTLVSGLVDGGSYSYYVRCQDSTGNTNLDDFVITFSVGTAASGSGNTASSTFSGVEAPLFENGTWGKAGSWNALSKNNGAYSANFNSASRLVNPLVSPDQFAEITYDHDPGSGSWPGVMTRMQGAANGSGYLAIAFAGQVRLYRADDSGALNFFLLASADVDVSVAPRLLRLESQGASHRVYFNGALLINYTDSSNVYATGQPGIASSAFAMILSFSGGALGAVTDTQPPARSGGQPSGVLGSGTVQTTLSLMTDENATCRYATSAGVPYGSMNTFSSTGGTTHTTLVSGLVDGGSYSYYVRCQDSTGNTNLDDFVITFSVGTAASGSGNTASSTFSGVEAPLFENGTWGKAGSWNALSKNNGAYSANFNSASRLVNPLVSPDQFAEITYDHDPGSGSWPGVMTRMQGAANGSGYLAIAFAGQVRLYRADDSGALNFFLLASADVDVSVAPRLLRLESQGASHRVYFNGALLINYTDSSNVYATGQPGIASSAFAMILSFSGGALGAVTDTQPPARSGGQPSGVLGSGTVQTTLSLMTDENATCRYATSAGVPYGSMNTFSSTGGTTHTTLVSGLVDGGSYSYYVRCQDSTGNTNLDDFVITFSVGTAASGSGNTASSTFSGVEAPLFENGTWGKAGSWNALSKNNGAYSANFNSASRLVNPLVSPDQFAEITYDHDPGSGSWPGVMTRMQGAANGSGYLAIAFAGQVRLYRADDSGALNFFLLASADVDVSVAPRLLRLESQGASHRVYFNGALLINYTDSSNVYATGQPGIASSAFAMILSFSGGALGAN